jgi:hypothetical protein
MVDEFVGIIANQNCEMLEHGDVVELHFIFVEPIEIVGFLLEVDEHFDCVILVVI